MSLLPFFTWMNELGPSVAIRENIYVYPLDQAVHLLALSVFAGAILIVDLRLLGRGMTGQPIARVARDAQPWMIGGFVMLLITGIPQLMSNAIRNYYSDYFWWKMELVVLGLIFTFTLRRKVTQADEGRVGPFWAKVVGLVSIALWFTVATLARLIGLLS